jgi:hypothetical protein
MESRSHQIPDPNASNRAAVFSIVCGTHFVNHFQSAMLGVITGSHADDIRVRARLHLDIDLLSPCNGAARIPARSGQSAC